MREHQQLGTALWGQGGKPNLFGPGISWEEPSWKKIPLFQAALDTWTKTWQPFPARLDWLLLAATSPAVPSYHSLTNSSNLLLIAPRPVLGWGFFVVVHQFGFWFFFFFFSLRADLPWHWRATFYSSAPIKGCRNPSWSRLPAWGVSSYLSVGGSENGLGCLETWMSIF